MKDQVPDQIKAVRTAELIELSHRKQAAYEERLIGTTQEVLIEEKIIRNGEELQIGHTKEYVKIGVKNPNNLIPLCARSEVPLHHARFSPRSGPPVWFQAVFLHKPPASYGSVPEVRRFLRP